MIRFLKEYGIAKRQAASGDLKALEKLRILESRKVGKENLYLNTELFEVLSK